MTPLNPSPLTVPSCWVRFTLFLLLVSILPPLAGIATPTTPFLDLSKATKLKDLKFRWGGMNVGWITMALKSVKSESLQHITVQPVIADTIEKSVYREWQDLDRLLAQFWITHSIRPCIAYKGEDREKNLRHFAPRLLPKLTGGGLVDLVEAHYYRTVMV